VRNVLVCTCVTTCCRQEKEHKKEIESMQSEMKDLRAHIRNALAATQVTKLWLGGAAARPICSPARFGGVGKGEGLGAPTDRGALSPMAVGVKHADSRYSGCECLWYRRKYRIASAQPAIVRVHLFASLNCTGPGSRGR
jgi:hypothetical protein